MSRRKLPDVATVRELVVERGLTYQQVADMYGSSKAAVGECLRTAAIPNPRGTRPYRDTIPWTVKVEHNNDVLVRRLRLAARKDAGAPLTPANTALLDQWLAYMQENDAVVTYSRDHGFRLSKRRPGDGPLVRP